MMNRKIRFIGLAALGAAAIAASAPSFVAPSVAVSTPSMVAAFFDTKPQRSMVAQAHAGGQDGDTPSGLPGGASSLNETYQDWRVACVQQAAEKRCALSQVQTQQNGQRVLAIELGARTGDVVSGTLVLPFGLALDAGVTLHVDENAPMEPLRFRTCMPGGCLVSISFDAPAVVALRAGAALKATAVADGGTNAQFSISLSGFAAALDRVVALSR